MQFRLVVAVGTQGKLESVVEYNCKQRHQSSRAQDELRRQKAGKSTEPWGETSNWKQAVPLLLLNGGGDSLENGGI